MLSSLPLGLQEFNSNTWSSLILVTSGACLGCISTFLLAAVAVRLYYGNFSPSLWEAADRRRGLPQLIVLIRHAESAANADKSLWKLLPDNLLGITDKGKEQAKHVGTKLEALMDAYNAARVHLIVSPFERTLQTAANLRPPLEHRIVRTSIDSRIREQEMGNLQDEEFNSYRQEQNKVGRFWYRFPTGESGADVYDRVASWWFESVLTVNLRIGFEPVDALVVVTHGLTIRFILMQLFGWSPTTFHSVWNADNCDMYVLKKDITKPGNAPYVLDATHGVVPRSSIDVRITFKPKKTANQPSCTLQLENYLSVPPPRTTRIKLVKHMLAQQHPNIIKSADDIATVCFMPFMEGGIITGRSTSGVASEGNTERGDDEREDHEEEGNNIETCPCVDDSNKHDNDRNDGSEDDDQLAELNQRLDPNDDEDTCPLKHAKREMSLRYPCIQLPDFSASKLDLSD